jgi:hypothetical protein
MSMQRHGWPEPRPGAANVEQVQSNMNSLSAIRGNSET